MHPKRSNYKRLNEPQEASAALPVASGWYGISLSNLSILTSPSASTTPVDLNPPIDMPADVAGLAYALNEIASKALPEETKSRVIRDVIANYCSALTTGRLSNKVHIVSLGETGHGKSSTINKLVGRELLKTGDDESTTKDIQSVDVSAVRSGVRVTLGFVDTPGLMDTTVADRSTNAVMFYKYRTESFMPRSPDTFEDLTQLLEMAGGGGRSLSVLAPLLRLDVYPNVILLTARWNSIKKDAHNEPNSFSSPMGRAIWALHCSQLYDFQRPNVVLVVTASVSDTMGTLDLQEQSSREEWCEQSEKKRTFIHAIQQRVFPETAPWPIVFVENWGGPRLFTRYDTLPNGELSHQNLYNAMFDLFNFKDAGGRQDLLGLQALGAVVAGAKPHSTVTCNTRTLQSREPSEKTTARLETSLMYASGAFNRASLPFQGLPLHHIANALPASILPSTSAAAPPKESSKDLDRTNNAIQTDHTLHRNQSSFWGWLLGIASFTAGLVKGLADACNFQ